MRPLGGAGFRRGDAVIKVPLIEATDGGGKKAVKSRSLSPYLAAWRTFLSAYAAAICVATITGRRFG